MKIKIEGDGIPSVEEIEERKPDLTTEVVCIKSVTKGSLIICVDVSSSAFHHVGIFLEVIDTLVSGILQRRYKDCNGHTTDVIIFLDFMDTNNGMFKLVKSELLGTLRVWITVARDVAYTFTN